jgi:hypothetical protein
MLLRRFFFRLLLATLLLLAQQQAALHLLSHATEQLQEQQQQKPAPLHQQACEKCLAWADIEQLAAAHPNGLLPRVAAFAQCGTPEAADTRRAFRAHYRSRAPPALT